MEREANCYIFMDRRFLLIIPVPEAVFPALRAVRGLLQGKLKVQVPEVQGRQESQSGEGRSSYAGSSEPAL